MALPQKNKNVQDQRVQDAVTGNWVDRYAPEGLRPYLRLSRFDRPVGSWLLFLPCFFGATLAGGVAAAPLENFLHFVLVCLIGSWLMRGAGCTWNDIVDRHIDAQVDRTKSRPLPSGAVNVYQAGIWMCFQAVIALMALATLEWRTILTAIASLAIVAVYPFAKRFTNWPQVVLGLAFNWGVIVAYVELVGHVNFATFALYGAMIFWTLFYDSIYAFQDIRDDEVIGVKSTARVLKARPLPYLLSFATISFVLILMSLFYEFNFTSALWLYLIGAILFYVQLLWQIGKFDASNSQQCLNQFRGNVKIGQLASLFWLIGYCVIITIIMG